MKIALIGDVHANLPALEAVLAHAAEQRVEAVWNVGDFVGYGAFPDEVVTRLRLAHALSIVGNYDLKALQKDKLPKHQISGLPSSGPTTTSHPRIGPTCGLCPRRYAWK